MTVRSAGVLLYKRKGDALVILLVHPGGPFWRKRDAGSWSIPKGEYGLDESPENAARREFEEELGYPVAGSLAPLGEIRQTGGKLVAAFACEGDFDVDALRSNRFELEWPPRSGRIASFPEVDRVAWFSLDEARAKILDSQRPFIDLLEAKYGRRP